MLDRQLAWSDPKLMGLAERFVPCADEVWRLQNGKDFECELFRRFCDLGHYSGKKSTRQGVYVVTPSGRFLGSINSRNVERLAALMRDALRKWANVSADERRLDPVERSRLDALWRWSEEYPEDGLVLEVLTRDLPRSAEAAAELGRRQRRVPEWRRWNDGAWNRDYAWFRLREAERWLPPEDTKTGATYAVPESLVERLARFHLVDCVRGQTDAFERKHLERMELTARLVERSDQRIRITLDGGVDAVVKDGKWPRSIRCSWEGEATWNTETKRFDRFRLVAVGNRMGRTRFNGRQNDPGPSPIGVVMRLAAEDAPRIAPTWVYRYGWRPSKR